jgi:Domain of unknown function (DUF4124)
MRSPVRLFAALAILLATATVTAQVFKWIDKDGKVHFTDTPPPADAVKGEAKKLTIAPSGNAGANAAAPKAAGERAKVGAKDSAKEAEKSKADAAEKAKKEEDTERIAKQNEERCREAKRYLSSLETGQPLVRNNDAGERTLMSDAERAAEVARAKTAMSESCKT